MKFEIDKEYAKFLVRLAAESMLFFMGMVPWAIVFWTLVFLASFVYLYLP